MRVAISPAQAPTSSVSLPSTGVFGRYVGFAAIAAGADLVTKAIATAFLQDGRLVHLVDRASLFLVYNTGTTGGMSIGPFTFAFNVIVTIAAIAMIMRIVSPLAAVDSRAVVAAALVTGGAAGNLASMLAGPSGVADFLAIDLNNGATIVMNGADLLLWIGALMLLPVIARLIRLVRAERAAR